MPDSIDAHVPQPGDLLFVINPQNSHGDPTGAHDFVVLGRFDSGAFTSDPPKPGMVIACLGVASITPTRPFNAETMVMLRHGRPPTGDSETGLVAPCAVQIDWPELIPVRDVRGEPVLQAVGVRLNRKPGVSRRRHVDEQTLAAIYRKMNEYAARRRAGGGKP